MTLVGGPVVRRRSRRRRRGPRSALTPEQILAWADAHHRRTGRWPVTPSGPVAAGPLGLTWRAVDNALRLGLRGLGGGSSLARLLAEHRGVRNQQQLPRLSPQQILAWADDHHQRSGAWPTADSGPIADAPGEAWRGLDTALRVGLRGLPGGSSLARLLAKERGVRNLQGLPRLTALQILAWADAHHRRTGEWPGSDPVPVREAPGETWAALDAALLRGRRGLPAGSSLARLLAERRGVRHPGQLPHLTVRQILAWARAHRRRTGEWPTRRSGPVAEAPGETWSAIDSALGQGYRGLPAGLTLPGLLAAGRAVPAEAGRRDLRLSRILAWADAHRKRTGAWPRARSGPIADAPGETWRGVDKALRTNRRGLTGGPTLARLLGERRGVRSRRYPPQLAEKQVLTWAERHRERTGEWPTARSGPVEGAVGETWRMVDTALRGGSRGLRGGRSLAALLAAKRGARNRRSLPALTVPQVLAWAKAHQGRTGAWPTDRSGNIAGAPGETWKGVNLALRWGYRGLKGGVSLARLLAGDLGVRNRTNLPALTAARVVGWAKAHHRHTGEWPTSASGGIGGVPGETWHGVDLALRRGYRGLPGGSSLGRLLREYRGGSGRPAARP
jgi:hypothetical protein